MTITLTKSKLALAVLVAALLVPATAWASHVFDDVDDGKFYAEPVEWAADNNITTGKTATTFAPDDPVTRGESVTFLKRYNDNVVDPALDDLDDLEADVATLPEYLWATVSPADETAAIVRGRGAESVDRIINGYYSVTFERDVSECAWVASYGEPDNSGVDARFATVRGGEEPQEVRVVIFDTGDAQVDGDGFHLMVVCDPESGLESISQSASSTTATDTNLADG